MIWSIEFYFTIISAKPLHWDRSSPIHFSFPPLKVIYICDHLIHAILSGVLCFILHKHWDSNLNNSFSPVNPCPIKSYSIKCAVQLFFISFWMFFFKDLACLTIAKWNEFKIYSYYFEPWFLWSAVVLFSISLNNIISIPILVLHKMHSLFITYVSCLYSRHSR